MTTCKECKSFFPLENDPSTGDCVQRVKDPRQAYYQSRPAKADNDAGACESFQKKQNKRKVVRRVTSIEISPENPSGIENIHNLLNNGETFYHPDTGREYRKSGKSWIEIDNTRRLNLNISEAA